MSQMIQQKQRLGVHEAPCRLQELEEQAYFAVFDGHGGVDAAIYAANHLHVNLAHQESLGQDPSEALCRAFKLTDEGFVKKASREVNAPPDPLLSLTRGWC